MDIQPNNQVFCTATNGSTLYLGGSFTKIGSLIRNRVASYDLTTGQITSFNPSFSGVVRTICVGATKIAFGGNFTSVSYNGASIRCSGIILYDIALDAFYDFPTLDISNTALLFRNTPDISEIVYHSSSNVFYACGEILVAFVDYGGISRVGVTGVLGIFETTGGLIDLGWRSLSSSGKYVRIDCNCCVIYSNVLYTGVQNANSSTAFNIVSPADITPNTTWDACLSPTGNTAARKMSYIDGDIWIYRYSYPTTSTYYKKSAPGTIYTVGKLLILDPTDATVQTPTTNGLTTDSFSFMGAQAVTNMWEDGSYVYLLGSFWGIGLTGHDTRNTLGGIARISKSTYGMSSEKNDLRNYQNIAYTNNTISYLQIGWINCYFTYNGEIYTMGYIGSASGQVRSNAYAPYIVQSDFSKKQYSSSLLV
jgi:hypothetical protein